MLKSGLIASCTSSGGDYYFFEKTARGLVKRFQVGLGMNDYLLPQEKVHRGYYDIIVAGSSARGPFNVIYRWNGNSYHRFKIVE
jgi:hypothetical protein